MWRCRGRGPTISFRPTYVSIGCAIEEKVDSYREECTKNTDQDGKENYQEEAESGAFVARSLRVDNGEGERSVAADYSRQIVDAVQDGDGIEKRC